VASPRTAEQGYALAQANLGAFYLINQGGLAKNEREAARLFKLAADQGYAPAQLPLGLLYLNGQGGLTKNEREAARLFKLAADQGYAPAQYNLGVFYVNGQGGLAKDEREAARLFKLAADQGLAQAKAKLSESKTDCFECTCGGNPEPHLLTSTLECFKVCAIWAIYCSNGPNQPGMHVSVAPPGNSFDMDCRGVASGFHTVRVSDSKCTGGQNVLPHRKASKP
jgi:hypothetical protein